MGGAVGAFREELSQLRRGRGVMAGDLPDRLGPSLCSLAGIEPGGNVGDVRKRLIRFLDERSAGLPEDLRTAFDAALALREDVRFRFLDERMHWLAGHLERDVRTARRRADEAFKLVEVAATIPLKATSDYEDWYLSRLRSLLLLDGTEPSAVEERTVVAARDDLSEICIATSIPVPHNASAPGRGAQLRVLYGGSLIASSWPTATYFRYAIRLPRPLRRGQSHEFGISITTPRSQPFNPRYSIQPLRRCDEFELRIGRRASGESPGCPAEWLTISPLQRPWSIQTRPAIFTCATSDYGWDWSMAPDGPPSSYGRLAFQVHEHCSLAVIRCVPSHPVRFRCQDSRLSALRQAFSKWPYKAVQKILIERPCR